MHSHITKFKNNIIWLHKRLVKTQNGAKYLDQIMFKKLSPLNVRNLNFYKFKRTVKKILIDNTFYNVKEYIYVPYNFTCLYFIF